MAPHSSTLAWKIPWTEAPGRFQSMGSLRVGHDWATSFSLFTFMHWRRNGNPLQCSCLENPREGGSRWAAVSGVAQSRTQLKWSSSSLGCIGSSLLFGLFPVVMSRATVSGVAQSQIRLKRLSSSSSRHVLVNAWDICQRSALTVPVCLMLVLGLKDYRVKKRR